MITHTKGVFRKPGTIIPITIPSTTAGVVDLLASSDGYGLNFDTLLYCSTGTVFFNTLVAATTANGFRLNESEAMEFSVSSGVSIIGDSTTAAYQAIVWG